MDNVKELHDAVYGLDFEAAVTRMQLLQQSITQHEGIGFTSKEELDTVEWLGADIEIVKKLKKLL